MDRALTKVIGGTLDDDDLPVTIVIPLYNEEAVIGENLGALSKCFDRIIGPGKWLFLLVENGSTDSTPEKVAEALRRWPMSKVVKLAEPNYGAALKAGLRAASTKWIYILDIEQWDLPFIAWAWKNRDSYDLMLASKRADPTISRQAPYRQLLSSGLNMVLQLFLQFNGTDTHGPKLVNRTSLQSIVDLCELDRGQFDTELVLRALRSRKVIVEVPFPYREMRPNRNWMIKKIVWNILALRRLVRIMKDVPFEGPSRYYRLSREDVLTASQDILANAAEHSHV